MLGLPADGHVRHGPLLTANRPTLPSITWLAVASPVPMPAIRNSGIAAIPRNFGLTGATVLRYPGSLSQLMFCFLAGLFFFCGLPPNKNRCFFSAAAAVGWDLLRPKKLNMS